MQVGVSNIIERQGMYIKKLYNLFTSQLIAKVFTENEPKLYFLHIDINIGIRFAPLQQLFCYYSENNFFIIIIYL